MLFTTQDTISPAQFAALIGAVEFADSLGQVYIDPTGHKLRIDGKLTTQQAQAAIAEAGLVAVMDTTHVSGGTTCCGGCS